MGNEAQTVQRRESTFKMVFTKHTDAAGTGDEVVAGDQVTVHCTGMGKNRDLSVPFWSTKDAGQNPFTFKIGGGNVIEAWDKGVLGMKVGESATIDCDAASGYGAGGFPAWGIMPNSPLKFHIEVLKTVHQ